MAYETPNPITRTEADAALEAGKRIGTLETRCDVFYVDPKGPPVALIPQLRTLADLSPYLPKPMRIQQAVTFPDQRSFAEYVNRFRDDRSLIFAKFDKGEFQAILDYHQAGDPSTGAENLDHTATLRLQQSEEWKAWHAKNRTGFGQSELAEFLEERRADIREPDAATILDAVRDLKLKNDVVYEKAVNDVSGSVTLNYVENVTERGSVTLPTVWRILLRPYRHCDPVLAEVRLRYRLREGKVTFEYRITRPDLILEAAFNTVAEKIAAETELLVLHGTT